MVALHGCNNLWSPIHTMLLITLPSCQFELKMPKYFVLYIFAEFLLQVIFEPSIFYAIFPQQITLWLIFESACSRLYTVFDLFWSSVFTELI